MLNVRIIQQPFGRLYESYGDEQKLLGWQRLLLPATRDYRLLLWLLRLSSVVNWLTRLLLS